nr:MAG: ORF7b protein [Longquan bat alphacoronavirus 1]
MLFFLIGFLISSFTLARLILGRSLLSHVTGVGHSSLRTSVPGLNAFLLFLLALLLLLALCLLISLLRSLTSLSGFSSTLADFADLFDIQSLALLVDSVSYTMVST